MKSLQVMSMHTKNNLKILDDLGIQSFVLSYDIATDVEGIEVIGATPLVEGEPNGVSEILSQGFIMNFQDGRKRF